MKTINSGNRKFYVIHFHIFLLVFSLLGAGCLLPGGRGYFPRGSIIKIFSGSGVSFSDKGAGQSSNN